MTYALALIALLVLWLWVRRRQARQLEDALKADRVKKKTAAKKTAFHAVAIRVNGNCCEAAREMQGRRILSTEAPHLPLRPLR